MLDEGVKAIPRKSRVIVLDFDATDDPVHGNQEGRFFHGYCRNYCYLPLYCFCGDIPLCAELRTLDRDGSQGTLEALLQPTFQALHVSHAACEAARSEGSEGSEAPHAARDFSEFIYQTKGSWSRARRVIGKAEILGEKENPRFIVTDLIGDEQWAGDLPYLADGRALYEKFYCVRGDMENRIKAQQLDLFADRTSTTPMASNQLRLWFSTFAYLLVSRLRGIVL